MAKKRIHYGATFAVLAVSAFAFSLLQSLVLPALPSLERSLHTSATGATWLLTGYLLSAAICTPILGRVGDMIGKEKMLVIVLVTLASGTLLSAVAMSLPVVLVGRVIQGAGGAMFPLSFGIIRDEFPPDKVTTGIGIISSILGIGAGAGIVLAGPDHRAPVVSLALLDPADHDPGGHRGDVHLRAGIAGSGPWSGSTGPVRSVMSVWLITGLLALSEAPVWGWTSAAVTALFAVTVILMALWIRSEVRSDCAAGRHEDDAHPGRVEHRTWPRCCSDSGCTPCSSSSPSTCRPRRTEGYGFGASVTQSGLFLAPLALAMLLVAPLTGRLAAWVGSKLLLVAGAVFGGGELRPVGRRPHRAVGLLRSLGAAGRRGGPRFCVHGQPHHRGGASRTRPVWPPE